MSSCLRGFLRIVTLKALADGEKSGYGLMKFVEEKVGDRPSAGSMYPLLDKLEKDKLIKSKKSGRAVLYSLTPDGRKRLKVIEKKRNEILDGFIEGMKMLEALTGEDMSLHRGIIEQVKEGVVPLKEVNPEWMNLKMNMVEMWHDGELKAKAGKVKRILKRANAELKRV